jgi:hypothetical protein
MLWAGTNLMGGQSLRKIQNPQEHAMGRDESNGGDQGQSFKKIQNPPYS